MKLLNETGTRSSPIRPNASGFFPRLVDGSYQVAVGNGSQYEAFIQRDGPALFVGVMGKGFWKFTSYVHASYAMEKLKLALNDASLFSNFINDQLPEPVDTRQGVNFIQAELYRGWVQSDYPVAAVQTALVKTDDNDDAALVRVLVVTEPGATLLADAVATETLKLAVWGLEKLFNETVGAPPKMLGEVVMAGAGLSNATQPAAESLAARHAERVRAAL